MMMLAVVRVMPRRMDTYYINNKARPCVTAQNKFAVKKHHVDVVDVIFFSPRHTFTLMERVNISQFHFGKIYIYNKLYRSGSHLTLSNGFYFLSSGAANTMMEKEVLFYSEKYIHYV